MSKKLAITLAFVAVGFGLMVNSANAATHRHRHHQQHHHHFHHYYKGHHQHHKAHQHGVFHSPKVSEATRDHVKNMIAAEAGSYGVPKWFALKIARVESNYNPLVTGAVGEIGVFQLKCQTARGIGYHGACSGLYDASTNVRYGLRYLSMAVKSSRGNLRLAASKHNGGLGRKSLVPSYVAMIF